MRVYPGTKPSHDDMESDVIGIGPGAFLFLNCRVAQQRDLRITNDGNR